MPGDRFCRACGFELSGGPARKNPAGNPARQNSAIGKNPAAGNAPAPDRGPVAERRVCSVLFCDLVGFTPL
ncbi:MAG TPA: hypothetical protein VJ418_21290, partial [Streptosporangiaceae bacterium]|nr:hypothetical protein [Streptosporangiaceae bacterium]